MQHFLCREVCCDTKWHFFDYVSEKDLMFANAFNMIGIRKEIKHK